MFDFFGARDPEKALQKAQEYLKEGKAEPAIKVLEQNLTDGEESFENYQLLARLYYEAEQREQAVRLLQQLRKIAPSRDDEIVSLISELFYRHPSIDSGDFFIHLSIAKERYEEIEKILRALSDREVKLLITRYDKLNQNINSKQVISKRDFENLIVLSALRFFTNEGEVGLKVIEPMINVDVYAPKVLKWARTISRSRFNDSYSALLLLKAQLANGEYDAGVAQAQRIFEKFPDFIDPLIDTIIKTKLPKDYEVKFSEFLTELYIKKGDFATSIEQLKRILAEDPSKIDDVIKGLRELQRVNPKDLKILYTLGDTYLDAGRVSLAINEFDKILEIAPQDYDKIIDRYKKAFEKEPNNPLVIQGIVNTYLKKEAVDEAVAVIERAYKGDPGLLDEYILNLNAILEKKLDNTKALYLLGLCYGHKGDKERALVIFQDLMDQGEYRYVDEATKEILDKVEDFDYINLRARSLCMLKRYDEAFGLIKPYLDEPAEKLLIFFSTLDMIINKQPALLDKVLPIYKRYKEEDPFIGELAMARANAFAGKYNDAVKGFERCLAEEEQKDVAKRALIEVIKERPDAVPLLLAAARIFMKEGELEIATQFFKTAQMVDPKAFFEIIDEFYDALKAFPKDREVRTVLIETFFQRKLWDRVIEEANRAIEVFGRNEQYFNLKLGQALVESGNLSDAVRPLMLSLNGEEDYSQEVIDYLDKILQIDKSNVPAHFARGRALSRAHHLDEAVDEYLLTVRILPARAEYVLDELKALSSKAMANPKIIFALGSVEVVLKRYDDAIKHLSQACELDSSLVKRVIPLFEKLSRETSSPLLDFSLAKIYQIAGLKNSAVKYYMKAQAGNKAYREPAISEMKKICTANPKDVESRMGLAELYFDYNNLEDASTLVSEVYELDRTKANWVKKFVAKILQKNPRHIPSYYFLAHIFLSEKSYKKCVEVYKKLLEMVPTELPKVLNILGKYEDADPEILFFLGLLHQESGDVKRSVELFNKLYSRDPGFGSAITYQIKEILKKNADMGEAYLLASKIFAMEKEYERAIESIHRAQELMPEKEDIILKEGQLYYKMGEPEKAIKLYTELLNRTKDRKKIYRLIRNTRNNYLKEKLEMIKGDDDEARLKRADIYLQLNKLDEAGREIQFIPKDNLLMKAQTVLRARLYLKRNRPIDALEIIRTLPVDKETALVYADIYEAMGSYGIAAGVLRQAGVEGVEARIENYEKLALMRRSAKGKYFIEGRS